MVGPNGAGKSTFVRYLLVPNLPASRVVNADEIAVDRWPEDPAGHSYEAAEIAAATRDALIDRRLPLIAETVFSHPSKLDLVQRAGAAHYYVALHVLLVPERLALERVRARVASGGHDVPVEKIRERYQRLWVLVAAAVDAADEATFWDNSTHDGPSVVAEFVVGLPNGTPRWPRWTPEALTNRWG